MKTVNKMIQEEVVNINKNNENDVKYNVKRLVNDIFIYNRKIKEYQKYIIGIKKELQELKPAEEVIWPE